MSLKDCKTAYMELSKKAFTKSNIIKSATRAPGLGPKFETKPLEEAIHDIIEKWREHLGIGTDEALLKEEDGACKV
jgi:hypothetical protein